MSFKSTIDVPNYSKNDDKTVQRIINNFRRNDSSMECVPGPKKNPRNKKLLSIFSVLNNIYKERVRNTKNIINDSDLIVTVYEEWNASLKKFSLSLIEMIEELEKEACNQLDGLDEKLNTSLFEISQQSYLKEDRDNLVKLIRRTFCDDRGWNVNGLKFNTITLSDIFGEDFENDFINDNTDCGSETTIKSDNQLTDHKKMDEILRDNDLLRCEVDYLKGQIKRDSERKNKY